MTDDSGIMSIDFLVGFTFFMISFIWVVTMVPGLFIGIQSHTIDYDAVAYRTGVILVEDPGAVGPLAPPGLPWEVLIDKRDIARFGLAVSKDTPRALDENKVNRFFCTTAFSYPADYQKRVIFGDYPYRFNISLRAAGDTTLRSVGDIVPDNYSYGYIRRDVKIKGSSNTTIGNAMITAHGYNNTENVTKNEFRIVINSSYLLNGNVGQNTDPNGDGAYRINPNWDRIVINFTDLDDTRSPVRRSSGEPYSVNLSDVTVSKFNSFTGWNVLSMENFTYVNENTTAVKLPVNITNSNLSMIFEPGIFFDHNENDPIYINMTFELDPPQQYLNNTHTRPFDYNYNPVNVTQPLLTDAVLEVAVW